MDGTPSSPNSDRLLYLEGINRKQTKRVGVVFWGDVVLVRSSAGFELYTLAPLQVRKKKDCPFPLTVGPEAPERDFNCPRLDSESVGDQGPKHGAQKS